MSEKGILENYSAGAQLGIYAVLAGASIAVFSLVSMMVVFPAYGLDVVNGVGWIENLDDPKMLEAMKVLQFFNAFGLFIAPSIVFAFLVSKNRWGYLALNKSAKLLSYVFITGFVITVLPLINWMAEVNGALQLPEFLSGLEEWMRNSEKQAEIMTDAFLQMNGLTDLLVNMVIIALVAAVGEEIMFRGIVQKLLVKITGNAHWGIWIAAILFSALHGQFYGFVPRMILGAVFGYFFYWSGSLWLPILAHFLNNGFAVLIAYFIGRGMVSEDIENVGAGENAWLFVVVSILLSGGILFLVKKIQQQPLVSDYNHSVEG